MSSSRSAVQRLPSKTRRERLRRICPAHLPAGRRRGSTRREGAPGRRCLRRGQLVRGRAEDPRARPQLGPVQVATGQLRCARRARDDCRRGMGGPPVGPGRRTISRRSAVPGARRPARCRRLDGRSGMGNRWADTADPLTARSHLGGQVLNRPRSEVDRSAASPASTQPRISAPTPTPAFAAIRSISAKSSAGGRRARCIPRSRGTVTIRPSSARHRSARVTVA